MRKHGIKISLNKTPSSVVASIREIEHAPLTDLAPRRKRGRLESFSARLDPEILREIKDAAARLNISQAVLVERAVIKYLELKG
jgi:predicted HicB family RNase H-like nuclease